MSETRDHFFLERPAIKLLSTRLREIPWITAELDTAITRQVAYADKTTHIARPAETPLVFSEDASEAAYVLLDTLRTWAHQIATNRHRPWPGEGRAPHFATWIDKHLIDLALCEDAPEAFDEICAAWKQAKQAIDRPPQLAFLGRCQSNTPGMNCPGLYARPGKETITCRNCGKVCNVSEMQDQLRTEIRGRQYTAVELASALTICTGTQVPFERIRNWIRRDTLVPTGTDAAGTSLYTLDDALDLFHRNPARRRRAS